MKLRKGLLQIITMLIALVGMISITTNSEASTANPGKILKMTNPTYRYSGYSYKAGLKSTSATKEQDMWKIYELNDNQTTIKNLNNAIYCLKMGIGFGSSQGSPTEPRTYEIYADMKAPIVNDQAIINEYKASLPSQENYNSILWILDHAYVPAPSTSPTEEQIADAEEYRKELLTNAGIPNSKINDDLIDIVQQIAIWYFSNNDQYKANEITTVQAKLATALNYDSVDDIFDNWDLSDDIDKLYNYFITNAEANKTASTTNTNPVSLISNDAKVVINEEYYVIGPYKIEEITEQVYTLEGLLTTKEGNNIRYTLLDSSKQETTKTLKDFANETESDSKKFYLRVARTGQIENAEFTLTAKVKQNIITYWTEKVNNETQPVAEVVPGEKEYPVKVTLPILQNADLALRKFITAVGDNKITNRVPVIDLTPLKDENNATTTAIYKHPKNPIGVSVGDTVIYTLRIYNEGEIDAYASLVTDYLPPQLKYINDEFNAKYGWKIDSSERVVTTDFLKRPEDGSEDTLIKAFDGTILSYKELQIKCEVVSTVNLDKVITNIAEVTAMTDAQGLKLEDRDSDTKNVTLPSDKNLPDYKGNASNKSILSDSNYFYKGQEDDDDFEKLILEEFDLALRKFITGVNDTKVTNRVPVFTNVKDKNGNYIYEHTKEPIEVDSTDIVEYTIRIYNEGDIAGYAKEVKDNIPEGLEFLPEHSTNTEYRWIMLDKDGNKTTDVSKAKYITTDYLSKEQEKTPGDNLIDAFDSTKTTPDYKEVKVAFKVIALNSYTGIITNTAEISNDSDEQGKEVEDRDSKPNNNNEKEDDIDVEHIKLTYFDLALRKFITAVNENELVSEDGGVYLREPWAYLYIEGDEKTIKYSHTKEPVEVVNGNIVTYTLRIYNEGTKAGYAKEVKDNIPEGLEFLPENEINKEYRWVMFDENGEETNDASKAVSITTDYLSKEQEEETGRDNLLKAYGGYGATEEGEAHPDYRDIKVSFKVTEPNTSDRIVINKAQISDDSDKNGNDVIDKDSTPDEWNEGEDDQDIEKIKVKYFDLALRKWVTQAIIIDNGKETVHETGHKAEDNPEEVVKVEIKESRLNKVVVKFRYKIRITNEGEIAGYATEISDYIPEGLKFVAADNPKWKQVDGKITTDQLKNTLLQPGETAEVEVLLTWINSRDNFGLKINTAEISKDKNQSNTPDIDSTPNNKKPGEDDIDDAPVILTIKTGAGLNNQNITLICGSLAILSVGVIFIKKYVL